VTEAGSVTRAGERCATVSTLSADLAALGVEPGSVLLVHSSLAALGWVAGGEQAVVLALQEALGETGTLVMPSMSAQLSEPSHWSQPAVPEAWWDEIRAQLPAFDPHRTPTREMGAIADCFRTQPGVLRSGHPQASFAAWGRHAARVVAEHSLTSPLGEGSPLARLYELDASVLLLGVGHGRNSSLHLAEDRATWPGKTCERQGAPIQVDGERRWVEFEVPATDESDFEQLGADLERDTDAVRLGRVARAEARLVSQRTLVDYAVAWLEQHRSRTHGP
jgi:aminoglycoside 3-N-acetyltransferase